MNTTAPQHALNLLIGNFRLKIYRLLSAATHFSSAPGQPAGWLLRRRDVRLLAALFPTLLCLHLGATTITWTNTAGGNWSNPSNWSPNQVPGQLNLLSSPDDVLITNAGTYTVVLDVGTAPNFNRIGVKSGSERSFSTTAQACLDICRGWGSLPLRWHASSECNIRGRFIT